MWKKQDVGLALGGGTTFGGLFKLGCHLCCCPQHGT